MDRLQGLTLAARVTADEMMPAVDEATISRVRSSVGLARAARTAGLRFVPSVIESEDSFQQLVDQRPRATRELGQLGGDLASCRPVSFAGWPRRARIAAGALIALTGLHPSR
jgi:hypothetical protein